MNQTITKTIFLLLLLLSSASLTYSEVDNFCRRTNTNYFYNITVFDTLGEELSSIQTPLLSCIFPQIFVEDGTLRYLSEDYTINEFNLDDLADTSTYRDLKTREFRTDVEQKESLQILEISENYLLYLDTGPYSEEENYHHLNYKTKNPSNLLEMDHFVDIPDDYQANSAGTYYTREQINDTRKVISTLHLYLNIDEIYNDKIAITLGIINQTEVLTGEDRQTEEEIQEYHYLVNLELSTFTSLSPVNTKSFLREETSLNGSVFNPILNRSVTIQYPVADKTNIIIYDHNYEMVLFNISDSGNYEYYVYYYGVIEDGYYYMDDRYVQLGSAREITTFDLTTSTYNSLTYEEGTINHDLLAGEYILRLQQEPGNYYLRMYPILIIGSSILLVLVITGLFLRSFLKFRKQRNDL